MQPYWWQHQQYPIQPQQQGSFPVFLQQIHRPSQFAPSYQHSYPTGSSVGNSNIHRT